MTADAGIARYGLGPIYFGRGPYEPDEDWMPKSLLCRCGDPIVIVHSSSRSLSVGDEGTLRAIDDHATSWAIECHSGHVLLRSHDIYEDDDSPDDPTIEQLMGWLGVHTDDNEKSL